MAETSEDTLYIKVHDAYIRVDEKSLLFPVQTTSKAVYLIRNPLDLAVSFAHHLGVDYDKAIKKMADEDNSFCESSDRLHGQLRQRLFSWSNHVLSWTEAEIPIHVLRYEDMKQEPFKAFEDAVRFLGLEHKKKSIKKAITSSSFEELQRQEREYGFREKSPKSELFFRRGEVGSWRDELSDKQAQLIIEDHGDVMHRFGYLDHKGDVIL